RAAGSVCAQRSGSCTPDLSLPAQVLLAKPLDLQAGIDVFSGSWVWSNNAPTDFARMEAGRDLREVSIQARAEGTVLLEAGRNVALNQYPSPVKGGSFVGTGDRAAAQLEAPDLYIFAGASGGADYDGFAAIYLDPANGHSVPRTYLPELRAYMQG